MGNPTGFIDIARVKVDYRPVEERVQDWSEVSVPLSLPVLQQQAARCMDCGIPFCHGAGCPVANQIPEFNDLVYRGQWHKANRLLHATNNFPEITGRVCPAPCEASCTLQLEKAPVNIQHIEYHIVEKAFAEGWIKPIRPSARTHRRVAVVGSGPAGLAAAQQLNRMGHEVVLFEKDDRLGGLLRYGIPDFKLNKAVIDRRLAQMAAEGVKFEPSVHVGIDLSGKYLQQSFDAVVLTKGAGRPRPLDVPGAELEGVHFALDFLSQQNRRVAGDPEATFKKPPISAAGKHVVVIGGGDTGSDCVGTSIRQGADSVTQIEILPKPPEQDNPSTPWPHWPRVLRTSSSHLEGCERRWAVATKELLGKDGRVQELRAIDVEWEMTDGGWRMREVPGTETTLKADLVLLAMGFLHVVHEGLVEQLEIERDGRGNILVNDWMTSQPGVFAAGDAQRGASLVVWAIHEGRQTAVAVDRYLR